MCKESSHFSDFLKLNSKVAPHHCEHSVNKFHIDNNPSQHIHAHLSDINCSTIKETVAVHKVTDDTEKLSSHARSVLNHHHHESSDDHASHDDVISLAHQHHDHPHTIQLPQGMAGFRQNACHAGDGHDHGGGQSVSAFSGLSAAPLKLSGGGAHHGHHHEGEHEHCPNCDEHLVDDECPKCSYKHHH